MKKGHRLFEKLLRNTSKKEDTWNKEKKLEQIKLEYKKQLQNLTNGYNIRIADLSKRLDKAESEMYMDGFKTGFEQGFETGASIELNLCSQCLYKTGKNSIKEEKRELDVNGG